MRWANGPDRYRRGARTPVATGALLGDTPAMAGRTPAAPSSQRPAKEEWHTALQREGAQLGRVEGLGELLQSFLMKACLLGDAPSTRAAAIVAVEGVRLDFFFREIDRSRLPALFPFLAGLASVAVVGGVLLSTPLPSASFWVFPMTAGPSGRRRSKGQTTSGKPGLWMDKTSGEAHTSLSGPAFRGSVGFVRAGGCCKDGQRAQALDGGGDE